MLTADEVVFAGWALDTEAIYSHYLIDNASGSNYWTLTPMVIDGIISFRNDFMYAVTNTGAFLLENIPHATNVTPNIIIGEHYGNPQRVRVRASIALKNNVTLSTNTTSIQNGTQENPYVID